MEKFWEPTLSKCFGSPELFLFFFVHSEKGSAALTKLVEDGDVTKEVALAMKHAAVDAVREWRDKVQVLQNKKLVLAINSTHISRSGYESLASSLRLESKDSPTCVSIQHLHDLPLALQLEELPGIVAATVHKRFETGWNVTWTTDEWIESMISSDCVAAIHFLLNPKHHKNKGWWLRKLYDLHNASFKTSNRLQCLQDLPQCTQVKKKKEKEKREWGQFVSIHVEWQDVKDASYVAYRWYQELHPRKRRRKRKVDNVDVVALPPIATLKEEEEKLLIGQRCADKPYQNAASGAILADLFATGYVPIGSVSRDNLQGSQSLYSN
ncbi:hypothetical protein QOT17_021766 [Balamuthia mandrillaris]